MVQDPLATFNFSYTAGGSAPAPQTTTAFTSGCGVLATNMAVGYESDQNWLTAMLNPSSEAFSVTMTAHPTGLATGTYRGAVAITDVSGEVWLFACTLTVSGPSKTSTATQIAVSPNPAISGQTVALTATVTPPAASGAVSFYDGTSFLGSAALSGGTAVISLSFTDGTHALTAAYSGNTAYASSTSLPISLQVNPGLQPTSISLSASPTSQSFGNPIVLTATVAPSTATGTVTFLDGQTSIGSAALSSGSASLTTSALNLGTHLLMASYSGDASDSGSNSATIDVTVTFANQPSILSGGIVNAASYAAVNGVGSPVAPGSLVAIFTSTLAAQPASFTTASLSPSSAESASRSMASRHRWSRWFRRAAYPFISAQVPFEALAAGQTSASVPVVITVNSVPSATVQTQMWRARRASSRFRPRDKATPFW